MTKYLHSMIRVTDVDATLRFFELIGVREVRRFDNEKARFTLIFLAAPGEEGVAEVELTYNWDQEKPYDLGSGFGHLAVGVPDVYGLCEQVTKSGCKVTRAPGPVKFGTTVIAFVEDPDGYKIELIERKPEKT